MDRLIAVGDIHGQYTLLEELIAQVKPTREDQLVFLGDYVDRGPNTPKVLDWLIEFKAEFPHTIMLRGNHEQMLLDALADIDKAQQKKAGLLGKFFSGGTLLTEAVDLFLSNGGQETLRAYRSKDKNPDPLAAFAHIPQKHRFFLERTKYFYRNGLFLFVHAGVDPDDPRGEHGPEAFLWQRRPTWIKKPGWNKVVVHGHTPVSEPFFGRWEIALDTGAGHEGRLTACEVQTKQIWQAGEGRI